MVGSTCGKVLVYKGLSTQPWKVASDLGSIVCFALGDVLVPGKNALLAFAGEGLCHIFDFELDPQLPAARESSTLPTGNQSHSRRKSSEVCSSSGEDDAEGGGRDVLLRRRSSAHSRTKGRKRGSSDTSAYGGMELGSSITSIESGVTMVSSLASSALTGGPASGHAGRLPRNSSVGPGGSGYYQGEGNSSDEEDFEEQEDDDDMELRPVVTLSIPHNVTAVVRII